MSEQMNILERAKAVPMSRGRTVNEDTVTLAVAWMRDEITLTQASRVLPGYNGNSKNVYTAFALALREAYRAGKITAP